jgi:hypothetical protein
VTEAVKDPSQEPGNLLLVGHQTNTFVLVEVRGLVKPVADSEGVEV